MVSVNIYLVTYFTQGTSRIYVKQKQTVYLLSMPRSIQPFLPLPTPVSISSGLCYSILIATVFCYEQHSKCFLVDCVFVCVRTCINVVRCRYYCEVHCKNFLLLCCTYYYYCYYCYLSEICVCDQSIKAPVCKYYLASLSIWTKTWSSNCDVVIYVRLILSFSLLFYKIRPKSNEKKPWKIIVYHLKMKV